MSAAGSTLTDKGQYVCRANCLARPRFQRLEGTISLAKVEDWIEHLDSRTSLA